MPGDSQLRGFYSCEPNPGGQEREEIQRMLEKINTALDLLDEAGPSKYQSWVITICRSSI
jgi:hypothetical protein